MKGIQLESDYNLNTMNLTNTPNGNLPNLTKQEFIEWVMECLPEMEVKNHHAQHWQRPDGRVLRIWCIVFPATTDHPNELIEFHATSHTLQQRTLRCIRKWRTRDCYVYTNYQGGNYMQHPSGYWYSV